MLKESVWIILLVIGCVNKHPEAFSLSPLKLRVSLFMFSFSLPH